ncbi:MAG: bifunctional UDP-N-acetylglucosamine diphosphorylase/glucosamine-1-phosphate N-acetyltransferase GlmU [Liquorilactobacillus ghanensis]|uniref:bifunctional UDP-N-acetylglucosamine diphosphorylase/glucosamine-1-phosphate N-acetyltransferase GlmU n=1 Tax=Liquorilactobacillus ghanensis TaxID=399370 RepID=UPI0039EB6708
MKDNFAIILAAGKGTRMKSKKSKVLHQVCGKTMIQYVVSQVKQVNLSKLITVVGAHADDVKSVIGNQTEYVFQKEQLGTGHAVLQTEKKLGKLNGTTLVLNGDTPLLTAKTLKKMLDYHRECNAAVTVLTAWIDDPTGYGRIICDNQQNIKKIVEQKDALPQEAEVKEINTGVYCFDNQQLFAALHEINSDNQQNEYYLTDVIEILQRAGKKIAACQINDFQEALGVNDRIALARVTKIMQKRIDVKLMANGVTLIDPSTTYVDSDVKIGSNTVIEPGVVLKGNTSIGCDCTIGANSIIKDSQIADGVEVKCSYLEQSQMDKGSDIGPNSHLRPQADIGKRVHIGNFVEVKKAKIGENTKVGHLTYVGDTTLGKNINVGCGTVFVNYDGMNKHQSKVGDYSFIGSGSNIIAPVNIEDHAYVAAGSTITNDVKAHDMAIARGRQVNKVGYYDHYPVAQQVESK